MVDPHSQSTAVNEADAAAPGWRFRAGLGLILLSFLSPLGALLLPFTDFSTAMKATLGGAFLAGIPEVFTLAAIAVMGKPGFAYVKGRIMALLRRYGPPKDVGPVRYYIGLTLWLIPGVYAWILMYAPPEVIPGFPRVPSPNGADRRPLVRLQFLHAGRRLLGQGARTLHAQGQGAIS